MGYCISLQKSDFRIKKENFESALQAIKKLVGKEKENNGGGRSSFGGKTTYHYSWIDSSKLAEAQSLGEALDEWRYPARYDKKGNIEGLGFEGEKAGDEEILFRAIAPYVENNSYIEMSGEDGAIWRWIFKDGKCKEVYPNIIWE